MKPTEANCPVDWTSEKVGRIVELRRGVSWSKDQEHLIPRDGTVPVLRISNVQDRLELDDILYLASVAEKDRREKLAGKGWSILVGSNGNRNRIGNAVYQTEDTEYLFASFLMAAKPRTDSGVMPEFFFRWLCSHDVQARLSSSAEGSTGLANLSRDYFQSMRLPIPPLAEQRAIAGILDAADDAIARARAAADAARRVKRGLVQQFFEAGLGRVSCADSPNATVAKGWQLVRTDKLLLAEPKNGISPTTESAPPGFITFSIAAVRDGRVDLLNREHWKYARISPDTADPYRLNRGDILIVRGNANPDLVGKCGIVDELPADCIYPDILKRVHFDTGPNGIDARFAEIAWNHAVVHNQVLKRAKTSNGTLKINSRDVKQIVMPLPPRAEQERFVATVRAAEALGRSLTNTIAAHERLKRGLMQVLLTGRVRVPVASTCA